MWFIIVLAIVVFLIMEHPVAFWLVFVPLGIIFLLTAGGFLRGKSGINSLIIPIIVFVLMILALLIVCIP